MIVYTMPKRVTDLQPGDIVVSNGHALYLQREVPAMRPYRAWEYTRYENCTDCTPAGHISAVGSEILWLGSIKVPVVCTDIRDGAVITP